MSAITGGSMMAMGGYNSMLEQRVRRIERVLHLPPLIKAEMMSDDDEEMAPVEPIQPRMEPPRFKLSGNELNEYHGETSMHDDGQQSITDPSPPVQHPSIEGWSPAEMRDLRRMRHKYATPMEGEAYIDSYFCWASTTTGVVVKHIFLRTWQTSCCRMDVG
jgi:hypothetical protein